MNRTPSSLPYAHNFPSDVSGTARPLEATALVQGMRLDLPAPLALQSRPRIEGPVILIEPVMDIPHLWQVAFEGGSPGRTHLRIVHPAFADPTLIAALQTMWRASVDPSLLADFSVFGKPGASLSPISKFKP